jgi:hypothetical protein
MRDRKRVIVTTNRAEDLVENEFGITVSLSNEEIKNYLTEIAAEIKKKTC